VKDISCLSPVDVAVLKARLESLGTPAPLLDRDWLSEGFEYLHGDRVTLAPPELVVSLMRALVEAWAEIDQVHAAYGMLKTVLRTHRETTDAQTAASGEGR
jgi:hypothetical protein